MPTDDMPELEPVYTTSSDNEISVSEIIEDSKFGYQYAGESGWIKHA